MDRTLRDKVALVTGEDVGVRVATDGRHLHAETKTTDVPVVRLLDLVTLELQSVLRCHGPASLLDPILAYRLP